MREHAKKCSRLLMKSTACAKVSPIPAPAAFAFGRCWSTHVSARRRCRLGGESHHLRTRNEVDHSHGVTTDAARAASDLHRWGSR